MSCQIFAAVVPRDSLSTMGQSDVIILAVSLLGFALIGYFLFSLTKQKGGRALNARDDNDGERDGNQHRPRGNLRRRRVGVANENNDNEDEEDEGDDNQQGENEPDLTGMTKKEIAKIEKRRAKAQQREAMEAEREERKEREEARMELLREREQERDEEFRLKEMERLRELAAEEQQRKDAYNHWKDPFPDHILTFPTDMAIATASSSTSSSTGATESRNKTAAEMAEVHERFIASVKEAKVALTYDVAVVVNTSSNSFRPRCPAYFANAHIFMLSLFLF